MFIIQKPDFAYMKILTKRQKDSTNFARGGNKKTNKLLILTLFRKKKKKIQYNLILQQISKIHLKKKNKKKKNKKK